MKNPALLFRRLFFSLTIALCFAISLQAQEMWCPKDAVVGLERDAGRAEGFLGKKTTTEPSGMTVYISAVNWEYAPGLRKPAIYVHSNYKPEGAQHAIKVVTTRTDVTMPFLLQALARESDLDISQVRFVVEQSFFSNSIYGQLDFGQQSHVKVIGPDEQLRSSTVVNIGPNKQERLINWKPYIYTWVTEPDAITSLNSVGAQSFDSKRVRFLNFVIHTKTLEKIEASIPSQVRLSFNLDALATQDQTTSLKQLEAQLAANPDSILFALGHIDIDTGEFVVENAEGKEVFRLAVLELERMAQNHNITVFALGCKSAYHTRRGTTKEIDSIEAIERFDNAMKNSNIFADFLVNLSSSNIRFVIDQAIVEGVRVRLEISIYRELGSHRKRFTGDGDGGEGSGRNGGGAGGGGTSGERTSGRSGIYPDGVLYVSYNPPGARLVSPTISNYQSPTPSPTATVESPGDGTRFGAAMWLIVTIAAVGITAGVWKRIASKPQVETISFTSEDPTRVVACMQCGVRNRVLKRRLSEAKCGNCHQQLTS